MQCKAKELNIELKKGVYAAVNGPNLETKAEYRYLKIIGADMVGMSTVPEVIAANHMQNCLVPAVSVITDECDPDNLKPVNIEEIIAIAAKADEKLSKLILRNHKGYKMKEALLIFAKNLIHGEVKTRLAATLGHDASLSSLRAT